MKKVLFERFGGLGDVAPVMVAARNYKKKYPDAQIDIALRCDGPVVQSDLLKGVPWVNKALDFVQIGPWGTRGIRYKHGVRNIESVYKDYDEVFDYMFITEGNNTCRYNPINKPLDEWKASRNSNWINWYDQHLMWVNIDPNKVSDEDKRPEFYITKDEEKYANIFDGYKKVVLINPGASSCARTWYPHKFEQLVKETIEKVESSLVGVWDQKKNKWCFYDKSGEQNIDIDVSSAIRKTMIYIYYANLYIGVDTGFTHVAEGFNKKHIALYSTVPWWTRAKYYKHQTHIDPGETNPEFYTFTLGAGDPLRIKDGIDTMSKREKRLEELYKAGTESKVAAEILDTDVIGLDMEFKALKDKISSFHRQQSKALSGVKVSDVFNKIKELLNV